MSIRAVTVSRHGSLGQIVQVALTDHRVLLANDRADEPVKQVVG